MTEPGQTTEGRPPRKRRAGATRRTRAATSARSFKRAEDGKKILELRKQGLAVRAIAEKVGRSKSEVGRMLQEQLKSVEADQETKKEVKALQLERLDVWLEGLWKRSKKGDEKAIQTALRIEERRAKMMGTDAPVEQRVKIGVLGQLNWVFDMIEKELGPDAVKRVLRRISEESGAPEAGEAGEFEPEA